MSESFETIRMEGKLFTSDHLVRIKAGDLPGITAKDYGRRGGRLEEEISRHWTILENGWGVFQAMLANDESRAYEQIRDYWLVRVFDALGFGSALVEGKPKVTEGKAYKILFEKEGVPIHIVAATQDLEKGPDGTARNNPHSHLQEYLNRSEDKTWGILTNGLKIRVLRDNAASKGAQYVEFDLQAMMSGQHFHEFGIFWRLMHVTRFTGDEPWIEKWMRESARQGVRAHKDLKEGVVKAIIALGNGFMDHRRSNISTKIASGELDKQDFYHELLRLVYRLLFLFVTEDRDLLLQPDSEETRKQRRAYMEHYSTQRLRRLARRSRGSKHHDAYEQLKVVMAGLKRGDGIPELALPGLNSDLWNPGFIPTLEENTISNEALYEAIRHLSVTKKGKQYHAIDYVHLDSEELGGIYETLLELHPVIGAGSKSFDLDRAAGNDRKTSGSYYTPPELVELTLDEALDPVLAEAAAKENPEKAILNLKVCDPTVGSGHFIIGAARRIARKLAQVRTMEEEPTPADLRHAIRDVVANCVYGVDINKMAVELCKVALWLEAIEPGKPLTYLEHRIKHGNGFFGATPKMLEEGIPKEAYKPLVLDDKETCKLWAKKNAEVVKAMKGHERLSLFDEAQGQLAANIAEIDAMPDDTVEDIAKKEEAYRELFEKSDEYHRARLAMDVLCAAWTRARTVSQRVVGAPGRQDTLFGETSPAVQSPLVHEGPGEGLTTQSAIQAVDGTLPQVVELQVADERRHHRFFHWHLEFPEVFSAARGRPNATTGWAGGFDRMLGNPPWEKLKIQKVEWFSQKDQDIAGAGTAAQRKRLINELAATDPILRGEYDLAAHGMAATNNFARSSGIFPLTGTGDVNTYAIFSEHNRNLIRAGGRVGCIVQVAIVTDFHTRHFFQELMATDSLVAMYGFENRDELFAGVHRSTTFGILICTRDSPVGKPPEFCFYAASALEARNPARRFRLSHAQVLAINPNTGTCPVFQSEGDASLVAKIASAGVPLMLEADGSDNPWTVRFLRVLHMSDDSDKMFTAQQIKDGGGEIRGFSAILEPWGELLPMYEGKLIHAYNHRFGTFDGVPPAQLEKGQPRMVNEHELSPNLRIVPRYWFPASIVDSKAGNGTWPKIVMRSTARNTDERTGIFTLAPRATYHAMVPPIDVDCTLPERLALLANLNSLALDYVLRNVVAGAAINLFKVKQLPVLPPSVYHQACSWGPGSFLDWLSTRSAELSLTAWDLEPAISEWGRKEPFGWNAERRFLLRAELDAAYFHLYGLSRRDVEHILATFPGVEKKERSRYGEFATQRYVLAIYDAICTAVDTGVRYQAPSLEALVETDEWQEKQEASTADWAEDNE